MADLETRLRAARPRVPEAPTEVETRVRAAAFAGLAAIAARHPERRWWTRRLETRRSRITAIAVAIAVVVLITVPALAASGILDLLPQGEERTQPLRAACQATGLRVSFDPAKGVALQSGDELLAFASWDSHDIAEKCTPLTGREDYSDVALAPPIYALASFTCDASGEIKVDVHPIRSGDTGAVIGSNLIVTQGAENTMLVSAVLKPGGSRIYRAEGACGPTS